MSDFGFTMLEKIIDLSIWRNIILGNTIEKYAIALIALFFLLLVFKIFQKFIMHRLKRLAEKTETDIDDALIKIVKSIKPPFYFFLGLWLALRFLFINEFLNKVINAILIIFVIYQIVKAVQILINYIAEKKIKDSKKTIQVVSQIAKGIIWLFGILLILSNLGVNITSLIAGLGIGGIAVALAIQNILGDLFSSIAIYFDKPFEVGDFIVVGKEMGSVEKIGIKTTRIRSLQGEEVIISNRELTSARVHNFKRLEKRRVVLTLNVAYNTDSEKLAKIPLLIKEIIDSIEVASFDRTHFKQFADSALIFEVVYYVDTNDYVKYLDINQEVHLKIKQAFEREKIALAFPTQTIHLAK